MERRWMRVAPACSEGEAAGRTRKSPCRVRAKNPAYPDRRGPQECPEAVFSNTKMSLKAEGGWSRRWSRGVVEWKEHEPLQISRRMICLSQAAIADFPSTECRPSSYHGVAAAGVFLRLDRRRCEAIGAGGKTLHQLDTLVPMVGLTKDSAPARLCLYGTDD